MPSDTDEERRRQENRRKYPEFAKFVDEVRAHFPGAKVKYLGPLRESTKVALRLEGRADLTES